MPGPEETRRALQVITGAAVTTASGLISVENPDQTRAALLEAAPPIVAFYSDGSSALAADHYDDLRDAAQVTSRFRAEPIVEVRDDKIRTGVLWATEPLFLDEPDDVLAASRLAEIVQYETARSFHDTITTNTKRDPAAAGWQRHTSGSGCKFCRMLSGRGAVYRADTARFASHPNCSCTASPVFDGDAGPPASVMQYVASLKRRSPSQQRALREFLAAMP